MEDNKDTLKLTSSLTSYVGAYRIGTESMNYCFSLGEKPKWLHRKFCEILLGWKWIDYKNCGS